MRLGDVPVALQLDGRLASLWSPAGSMTDEAPVLRVNLRASDEVNACVRWFEGSENGRVDELEGRGCRIFRRIDGEAETLDGTCHSTKTAVRHAVRFATQPALLGHGWLFVHAAAVEASDGIHVFAGPSAVGKSTLASFAARNGFRVHAEEITLLARGRAGGHWSDPWAEGCSPTRLAGVHFLARGIDEKRALSQAEACARLLSLTMVYERSTKATQRAVEVAVDIVENTVADVITSRDPQTALSLVGIGRP